MLDVLVIYLVCSVVLCLSTLNVHQWKIWADGTYRTAHSYQYSFAPNTEWSSFYAPAKEIHTYLDGVARKYSADRFIKTGHEVKGCYFDKKLGKWYVNDLRNGKSTIC